MAEHFITYFDNYQAAEYGREVQPHDVREIVSLFEQYQRIVKGETQATYFALPDDEQKKAKNGWGFVAGKFSNSEKTKRPYKSKEHWLYASMLSLDFEAQKNLSEQDQAKAHETLTHLLDRLNATMWTYIAYQTRSSTLQDPRWRIVIPFETNVTDNDVYQSVARYVANVITDNLADMLLDDNPAYQLMYGPSWSEDAPDKEIHWCEKETLDWEKIIADNPISNNSQLLSAFNEQDNKRGQPIPNGTRNNTLAQYAFKVLRHYSGRPIEEAQEEFLGRSLDCETPLSNKELSDIWNAAVKNYEKKGYPAIPYDEYQKLVEEEDEEEDTKPNKSVIIANAFEQDDYLKNRFGYDLFLKRDVFINPAPWQTVNDDYYYGKPIEEIDLRFVRSYFGKQYNLQCAQRIEDEMAIAAQKHKIHPVKNYFESLKWDGVKRAERYFCDYLGITDDSYTRIVTRKTLLAAVKRIYMPGAKFDYMLTLHGTQGTGKSTAISNLCLHNRDWFCDSIIDIKEKDVENLLTGHLIIEFAELAALGTAKTTINQIKSFISRQEAKIRLPYDKRGSIFKRQCIFMASTNEDYFLKDVTGNRRFWILSVPDNAAELRTKSPFEVTENDIDQIWAEVMDWWRHGGDKEELKLPQELESIATSHQEDHSDLSILQGVIEAYLDIRRPDDWREKSQEEKQKWLATYHDMTQYEETNEEEVNYRGIRHDVTCVKEIYEECVKAHYNGKELTTAISNNITSVLRALHWSKIYNEQGKWKTERFPDFGVQKAWRRTSK